MRTNLTTKSIPLGDNNRDASSAHGQTDREHLDLRSSPIASADSNDPLAPKLPETPNDVPQDQGIRQGMHGSKLTMSVSEAADWLGISRAFAYELVARGELPSIRLGRRVLVPTKRLYAFVLEDRSIEEHQC